SNSVSFAFLDVLFVMLVIGVAVWMTRAVHRTWQTRRFSPLAHTAGHLLAAAAAVYILFLVVWGFNYRRVHMPSRLVVYRSRPESMGWSIPLASKWSSIRIFSPLSGRLSPRTSGDISPGMPTKPKPTSSDGLRASVHRRQISTAGGSICTGRSAER